MSEKSYKFGVFLGRNKVIAAFAVLAFASYAIWPTPPTAPAKSTTLPEPGSPSDLLRKATIPGTKVHNPCDSGADERLINAKAFMKAADPDAAFELLHPCRSTLSVEAKALYGKALIQANAKREKASDAEAKRVRAEKKRKGVSIGMTEQDVLDSSWGKPQKINRTTNAYGVSEQWVYDGNYLYFKNGVLTTIQN